eukprot:1375990-Amphidinium_carterae.1
MRSCPIERSPSARLHPPVLQVHTKGPGFLASPILTTGGLQCRPSQAYTPAGRLKVQGSSRKSQAYSNLPWMGRRNQAS